MGVFKSVGCKQAKLSKVTVMSVVHLAYHRENVADLEKIENTEQPRCKRYSSRFSAHVRAEGRQRQVRYCNDGTAVLSDSKKHERKTMGIAEIDLPTPQNFLRKHSGVKWQRQPEHVCVKDHNLPPLPCFHEADDAAKCRKTHRPSHNFILHNIQTVKSAVCRKPTARYVDTPKGTRHDLMNTGLVPHYVQSARYGKVPSYIYVRKQQLQMARSAQERKPEAEKSLPFGVREMNDTERRNIIFGLKTNYDELTRTYHKLSLFTDTEAKKQRKTSIENQLRQLEQDILLMDRNPTIYVSQY